MKRSIILFLIAFLVTAGIGGGVFYAIKSGLISGVQIVTGTGNTTPDTTTTATTTAEPSRTGEQTTTDSQPQTTTTPAATTDTQKPTTTDNTDTTTQPQDTTTTPDTTGEQAPTTVDQPANDKQEESTTTLPEPPAEPTTTPEQPQAPRITLPVPEQPRSDAHNVALMAREALRHSEQDAAMKYLVERGGITPQAADDLLKWGQNNKTADLQEIADSRRPDGNKVTRYRLKSDGGSEDILLDVVTNNNQIATIESVTPTPSDKTLISPDSDHFTVTEGFMEAVRGGNMALARSLSIAEEVSPATVAGLCMIFEEDNFRMREHTPIRNTFQSPDTAGNLVYLNSTAPAPEPAPAEDGTPQQAAAPTQQSAQISLVLSHSEAGWRVKEVGLDNLLSTYESQGNEEGGRYFPIVKNPKGGDSLALFFGFNESDLTPRSLRQLQIVAELLKQTQGKLNISGHTDDVGSELYNLQLSERRAKAVKAALVGFGVQAEQITTHGLGKSQPRRVYNEQDSEQTVNDIRGENRRAEIYLDFES